MNDLNLGAQHAVGARVYAEGQGGPMLRLSRSILILIAVSAMAGAIANITIYFDHARIVELEKRVAVLEKANEQR